ncbi:MAG: hypothetical protein IPL61_32260 [Myxococcales bacterium]|nr:hypothetical protein [Myxococcales bacterium]
MRQLGVEPGALRRLRLHQIQNIETVLQVDSALRALGASLADPVTPALAAKLEATALGLYARTIARQSGHVVTGVELGGGRARWKLGDLMSYYETGLRAQADPKRARDLHKSLLTDHGLTRDAFVTTDFDLVFLLEDAP